MHGTLTAESEGLGQGARFIIMLMGGEQEDLTIAQTTQSFPSLSQFHSQSFSKPLSNIPSPPSVSPLSLSERNHLQQSSAASSAAAAAAANVTSASVVPVRLAAKKLLLVEDNKVTVRILRQLLQERLGYGMCKHKHTHSHHTC